MSLTTVSLLRCLHGNELQERHSYFWQNKHCVNYLEMREGERPIAPGWSKARASSFKTGFAGRGMRLNRKGLKTSWPVCSAILGGRIGELWAKARNLPPSLYRPRRRRSAS